MEQDGQLTFSDDPILSGINQVYQFIEDGNFSDAVLKCDQLMNINPNYPGLADSYRTSKFWNNRKGDIDDDTQGKSKADYLMKQWDEFKNYAAEKGIGNSTAYKSAMSYVFYTASNHYKIAFKNQESTADNFDLLLNLGICFLTLEEYNKTIDTLEYARSSYPNKAGMLAILGEANYHIKEIPRSLLFFREAFFINPSEIDLTLLKSKPILELIKIVKERKPTCPDVREWIPVFGFLDDVFYTRRKLNVQKVETIKREIYTLEENYQTLNKERIENSNIIPRLINKYLWMLDYFENQEYDFDSITEIRKRLLSIDNDLFEGYFKKGEK